MACNVPEKEEGWQANLRAAKSGQMQCRKGRDAVPYKTESGMAPCTTYRKTGSNAAPARGYCTKLAPSNRERPAVNVSTSDKVTDRHMDKCNDW
ncbi:hypothetical protein MAPG_06383 [Magnaporthiopsis poae ATCC 64411]|uniref:Uncharacterized protein n=1 Tax=Magnaporthiopsis poae (strain ATCC 64411 / 73-15) TaxID=644358 RepID=A0A0C4E1W1_MAGP6|nr:hypothetical protein MAPG_06383 [Magnaporthiopsis poae ATCC 64411]